VGIRVGVAKIVVVTGLGGIVGVTGFCGLWALKWAWQIGRHRFSRFVCGRGKLFFGSDRYCRDQYRPIFVFRNKVLHL